MGFVEQGDLLQLDLGLLKGLIQQHFHDETNALIENWPVSPAPGRTTLWRWLKGLKFPRNVDELFGLAGVLDVDPLALLSLSEDTSWFDLCAATREYHWSFKLAPRVARFWFLQSLIGPNLDWPSSEMGQKYFKRAWEKHQHRHVASVKSKYYGQFVVEPDSEAPLQVWHFAWRGGQKKPWRPYGFIRREQSGVHLCSFDGLEATASLDGTTPFMVETWFGKDDAEFCIASLHRVKCRWAEPAASRKIPTVRFGKDHSQT